MEIIKSFTLNKDSESGKLTLTMNRDYLETYLETDTFVIEKYKLDTNSLEIRNELAKSLKSQTVMQYMSDKLTMTSVFHMVPINNYNNLNFIGRAGNFRMNPDFIDISDFVKEQNTTYIDEDTNSELFLYLYRIVYNCDNIMYATDYVAGFENIPKKQFNDPINDKPTYNNAVSDETFKELYGDNWENVKKYLYTEYSEERTKYRQEPRVFKIPMQRFNQRNQGPLENYKLLSYFRDLANWIKFIQKTELKIKEKLLESYNSVETINVKIQKDYTLTKDEIDNIKKNILSELENPLSLIGFIHYRQNKQHRVLEFDSFSTSSNISNILKKNGLYIILRTDVEALQIYNLLLSKNMKLSEDVFILVIGNQEPSYHLEESI